MVAGKVKVSRQKRPAEPSWAEYSPQPEKGQTACGPTVVAPSACLRWRRVWVRLGEPRTQRLRSAAAPAADLGARRKLKGEGRPSTAFPLGGHVGVKRCRLLRNL